MIVWVLCFRLRSVTGKVRWWTALGVRIRVEKQPMTLRKLFPKAVSFLWVVRRLPVGLLLWLPVNTQPPAIHFLSISIYCLSTSPAPLSPTLTWTCSLPPCPSFPSVTSLPSLSLLLPWYLGLHTSALDTLWLMYPLFTRWVQGLWSWHAGRDTVWHHGRCGLWQEYPVMEWDFSASQIGKK